MRTATDLSPPASGSRALDPDPVWLAAELAGAVALDFEEPGAEAADEGGAVGARVQPAIADAASRAVATATHIATV